VQGRHIEPLQIIDANQQRSLRRQPANNIKKRNPDRPTAQRRPISLKQRNLQRRPARLGQQRQHRISDRPHKVSKRGEGKVHLRAARATRKHLVASFMCEPNRPRPQGALPDPGTALKHNCRRPLPRYVQQPIQLLKLSLAPDQRPGRQLKQPRTPLNRI
jgi:hypothetical protein